MDLKSHRCWFVLAWLISFTLYTLVYRWTWPRFCKIWKGTEQCWIETKFYKSNVEGIFILELQSINKFGQQVYLWRGEQQGALPPIITTLSCDFLKYSCNQINRWVGIFQKLSDSIVIRLMAPGEECHLDFSPKTCAYPTLVKIISILLHKNNNCPMLFCTFTIDNSSFHTTVTENVLCILIFI